VYYSQPSPYNQFEQRTLRTLSKDFRSVVEYMMMNASVSGY
jgi:hypothetical protein